MENNNLIRIVNIIGIDTSGEICSAGIEGDKIAPVEASGIVGSAYNESLFPLIQKAFDRSGMVPESLHGVAVCIGPGSFTGVRVGLSAAKGLAYSLNVPIIGITAFEALAADMPQEKYPLCCTVSFKKEKFSYVMLENPGQVQERPHGAEGIWDEIETIVSACNTLCGKFSSEKYEQLKKIFAGKIEINNKTITGLTIAKAGLSRFKQGVADDIFALEPIYAYTIKYREVQPQKQE